MKTKNIITKSLSLLAVAGSFAATAHAEAFFQASLWAPEPQIVPADQDVAGIRLQLYGENRNVSGLDLGLAHSTTGDFVGFAGFYTLYNHVGGTTKGVQSALVNYTQGEVTGWQSGWINVNKAKVTGLQGGFVNANDISTADFSGLQLGLVNTARNVHGVQIGLVNYAETLKGVQIGLWNQVNSREWDRFAPLPKVFPIINVGF
ncbi:MAG: hypothetical protein H2172_11450 [Opitutus sp.]|nr:hypothetical protein [Opitutus sp.]MCS6248177.1 hypothetical protein [Opitutus sp.]MCS6273445.1 hypothetical protein [Opitutus sp.]MCS6276963.1 hypothetical protein [Opitutus sp.]MCS6299989.1 hypothetical protein [Opitutus sp.]